MYDVGDAVISTINTYAADGVTLADATPAPVLTLHLPDGTSTQPAVVRTAVGTYVNTYVTAAPGRFGRYWQATGTQLSAYDDSFLVVAPDQLLIALEQARASLRTPPNVTVDDEDLRSLIAACTGPMEDICGPILRRVCSEWHDGGSNVIRLDQAPVIAVSSISESFGAGSTYTLTNQVLDGGGSFDAYGYTVDLDLGHLYRRYSGVSGPFMGGRQNVHVQYVAGRVVMSPNIQRATRRLLRWLWQSEMNGQRPAGSQPEKVSYTDSGYPVPTAVLALCANEKHIVGIG